MFHRGSASRNTSGELTPLSGHHLIEQMEKYHVLGPVANIYSYHLFMVPVEQKRTGRQCSWIVAFACAIVTVNLVMQFALLAIVGPHVVEKNVNIISSIRQQSEKPWYEGVMMSFRGSDRPKEEKCRDSRSLCYPHGGGITCAPPSIQVLGSWDLLDTDKDGIWSRSEAADEEHRGHMQCHYNVDVLVLFDDIIADIKAHPRLKGRIHSNLTHGTSVHKAYFDWYLGEPMLCLYGDQDMCGTLFSRGFFDGALTSPGLSAASERGIGEFQSARDYCSKLLSGRCDDLLPSTYRVWKVTSLEKCGSKSFEPFLYDPPDHSPRQWMLQVLYDSQEEYSKVYSWAFRIFLAVLMFTFFATMLEEANAIYLVFRWVLECPDVDGAKAHSFHRFAVLAVNLVRGALFLLLLYSGAIFLTEDTRYLHLIFDALSLNFIINIDELLYAALLRKQMKEEHEELPACFMERQRNESINIIALEFMRLGCLILCTLFVAYSHVTGTMETIREALQCVCSVEGPTCYEAFTYSSAWWERYWAVTLPASVARIDRKSVV